MLCLPAQTDFSCKNDLLQKEANIGRGIVFPGCYPLEEVEELEVLQNLFTEMKKHATDGRGREGKEGK